MREDDTMPLGGPRAEAVRSHLRGLADTARAAEALVDDVARIGAWIVDALASGGTLYFCGNGGSAADAQHLAAEYVVRFARARKALPAVALTVDTSVLTAAGNDFGFDEIFARQVAALGRPGDVLILHSTSGRSPNLLRAAEVAKSRGLRTVAFLARDGGPLRAVVDLAVVVPTDVTAHAQEIHLALGHAVCDEVDRLFAEREGPGDTPSGGKA
jgi:D-sedoheptulose 7-phosphate isomerase